MKIGIVVIFWNEWHLLSTQLLPNLEKIGWPKEDIIFIDSFFDQLARWEEPRESDDGSVELLRDYKYRLYHAQGKMLDICNLRYTFAEKEGWDAILWLDSDEYITGDIDKFRHSVEKLCKKYNDSTRINISFKDWNKLYDYTQTPQLIVHPKNCIQKFAHTIYFNKNTSKLLVPKETITDITINHDDTLRPDKRDRLNNAFSVVNGRYEKLQINNALASNDPWIKGVKQVKNE